METQSNTFLNADSSIMENNLRFIKDELEDELKNIFEGNELSSQIAKPDKSRIIQPEPGFCIKAFLEDSGDKIFINICKTPFIPAPPDHTEAELREIIYTNNVTTYKIPMSISSLKQINDRSGNPASGCDIAINSNFFQKVQSIDLFRQFLITIIFEAIEVKYEIKINLENWVLLKNRQAMGGLIKHCVRESILQSKQNDEEQLITNNKSPSSRPLIEEINEKDLIKMKQNHIAKQKTFENNNTKTIQNNLKNSPCSKVPKYQLYHTKDQKTTTLVAEFHLPECNSVDDVNVLVGADRVVLETTKSQYYFDSFVDYTIDQGKTTCKFNVINGVLKLIMPVI